MQFAPVTVNIDPQAQGVGVNVLVHQQDRAVVVVAVLGDTGDADPDVLMAKTERAVARRR